MVWVGFLFLVAIVVAALVRPLLGRGRPMTGGSDVEVYAAQLAEIDADKSRGLIDDDSALAARAEVGRRLLRADKAERQQRRSVAAVRWSALAVIVCVPAVALSLYVSVGAPGYHDQPLSARVAPVNTESMDVLLARAEERLTEDPDDVEGWLAVAPIYQRMRRYNDAALAYARINSLLGDDAEWLGLQGENLTFANDGIVPPEAEVLFERAMDENFIAARPRIFLAIAARQQGDFDEARERWKWLLDRSMGTENWLGIATAELNRIDEAEQAETVVAAAPSAGPVAGAPEAQMIAAMVQRLADRLESDGGTPQEWLRLVRAHRVMGNEGKAVQALVAAAEAHPEARAELLAAPESNGLALPESVQ